MIASVKSGRTIHEPLSKSPVFPSMVAQMIGVGEETGALDAMLSKIADFYEDEVETAVKALTSILEPVMIIIVGGIVGVDRDLDVPAAVQHLQHRSSRSAVAARRTGRPQRPGMVRLEMIVTDALTAHLGDLRWAPDPLGEGMEADGAREGIPVVPPEGERFEAMVTPVGDEVLVAVAR